MARPIRWFTARVLPLWVASFALVPVFLLAESHSEPAEALVAPPLPLETEVMVPPALSVAEPPGDEAIVPEASPLVEVPPVVSGPSFLGKLLSVDPFTGPLSAVDMAEALSPDVPSIAVEPAEPIAPPPMTSLDITLDWYLNPQHATLLIAREKGMFQRRGLDVTLISPADPNVPAKLLAAGRTDLAVGRQPQLHLLAEKGLPLVRVATLIGTPMAGLVLREAPGNGGGELQLEGMRIGHTDIDGRDILLAGLLRSEGGGLDLVETEDTNYSVLDAMREGNIDGILVNQRYLLPRQLADEGIGTYMLRVEEYGIPSYDGLILMANRDYLNGKRDAFRYLLAALEEATLWILNHPEQAWELLIAAEPALDDLAMHAAWLDILPRLALRPAAVDQGRYHRFERYLLDAGIIQTGTSIERLAKDLGALIH
ncbi:ABC transporter substrate-binding protein [Billgrantia endophytica]|nr:ABC transporter substrate-binding protein [Halomonas endophytica]